VTAAAAIEAASTRDTACGYFRKQEDAVTARPAAQAARPLRIDTAELPVSHLTRRQGRPYTLVLSKTDALFTREREARIRDMSDLEWLAARWAPGAESV
jgi:hypothetical protein